jgi:hypothetical protein
MTQRPTSVTLACLAIGLCTTAAQASPFKTPSLDSAETWELKVIVNAEDSASERTIEGPLLDITAPIRPGLETSVTFGRGYTQADGEGSHSGMVDTEWAVKWEIIPASKAGEQVTVTTEPALIIPTGAEGLSDDAWRVEVPIIIGRDVGPWQFRALAGYGQALNGEPDGEFPFALLATRKVRDNLRLGVELAGDAPAGAIDHYKAMIDVGFKWEFAEGLELQGRLGRSIRTPAGGEPATNLAFYLEKAF